MKTYSEDVSVQFCANGGGNHSFDERISFDKIRGNDLEFGVSAAWRRYQVYLR